MGYQSALEKAWDDLAALSKKKNLSARLFTDEYSVDTEKRLVLSLACNVPAKDYTAIIILHYLIKKCRMAVLPRPAGEWIDFKDLEGGEAYYPTFRKRTIDRVVRKFGSAPDAFLEAGRRYGARKADIGDIGLVIQAFSEVPILIALYKADDEFGPDANILYDKDIPGIFCTEDIIVLTEILIHSL